MLKYHSIPEIGERRHAYGWTHNPKVVGSNPAPAAFSIFILFPEIFVFAQSEIHLRYIDEEQVNIEYASLFFIKKR
jgi:hypothetical protein